RRRYQGGRQGPGRPPGPRTSLLRCLGLRHEVRGNLVRDALPRRDEEREDRAYGDDRGPNPGRDHEAVAERVSRLVAAVVREERGEHGDAEDAADLADRVVRTGGLAF